MFNLTGNQSHANQWKKKEGGNGDPNTKMKFIPY